MPKPKRLTDFCAARCKLRLRAISESLRQVEITIKSAFTLHGKMVPASREFLMNGAHSQPADLHTFLNTKHPRRPRKKTGQRTTISMDSGFGCVQVRLHRR